MVVEIVGTPRTTPSQMKELLEPTHLCNDSSWSILIVPVIACHPNQMGT